MRPMTSLERCLAVLDGRMPDTLPVVPQSFMYAVETAGFKMSDVSRNGRKMAAAHRISQEKHGYDGCVIDFDDAAIAEAIGARVIYRDTEPAIVDEERPVLKDLRDVHDLEVPDPWTAGRLPEWLEATKTLSDAIGGHVLIMGRADQGPFSIACLLRGMTQFMMDLMTADKALIADVLDFGRKCCVAFAKAQKEAGAHVTSIGEGLAGPSLISPGMYREFAFENERRAAAEIQAHGLPLSLHICGNAGAIIPDMGATGAKILEVDWQVDMKKARETLPASTVLMGNINPSHPLVFGKPEQIDEAVKQLVLATKGRGLIISSGCAMGRNTPPENVSAFVAAARKHGSGEELEKLHQC
ncbi:uroporphyrinogen decarboxylase family protein [Termitidicoccus mucosus]|uniref:Uroporphyrinogen decarboxylase n=1 Tax=Termitidicoccus mucosus TaxID=1184151 RepID=A0A178II73_9BACT|nr:uroporphyrinogen decarboxylase [Opitutaceae bacterium TSB47]